MNELKPGISSPRISVVDALRGFAVMSIMLLHNIEHFDYYYFPSYLPEWMKAVDAHVWNTMFALFSGKAYAIFAVLFGFTFFLMDAKQQKQGKRFGGRFMWRMLLLLGFGIVNSMFYSGDVLAIYAILGFSLVLVSRLRTAAVLAIAFVLLLQPVELIRYGYMLLHPEYNPGNPLSWHYFGQTSAYLSGRSFFVMAWGNMTNGRLGCTLWSWEHGRFFQVPALFMIGMVLGRTQKFLANAANGRFWRRTLIGSVVLGVIISVVLRLIPTMLSSKVLIDQAKLVVETWNNFTLTFVWISVFVLLYQTRQVKKLLSHLEIFGKMSLTNYVMQSIMGCMVYNGCGLALYQYTGASLSLMVGVVLFIIQMCFCRWWLNGHKQGPLEGIWHKLTWIRVKEPKQDRIPA
jgi:uncharacterized protein